MKLAFCVLLLGAAASLVVSAFEEVPDDKGLSSVARQNVRGVEVLINQIQMQKLGAEARVPKHLQAFTFQGDPFSRTIAISISQKGQGASVGPTHVELKNGQKLRPFLHGNQQFMSVVANAAIPDGYDFAEHWFQVPHETKFAEIFPITIVHNTTNEQHEKIEFRFENIEP